MGPNTSNTPQIEPPKFGIRRELLTEEILLEVLRIYNQVVGPSSSVKRYLDAETCEPVMQQLNQYLQFSGTAEWRFGSKLTGHSKLFIRSAYPKQDDTEIKDLIRFEFSPNLDSANTNRRDESDATRLQNEFLRTVEAYLQSKQVAVEVQSY